MAVTVVMAAPPADIITAIAVVLAVDTVVMAATVVMAVTAVTADIITVIGSAVGRVGFTAIAISGPASGFAGIRMATAGLVGMSAAPTGSRSNKRASGATPLADL
jgi:hypothetical protein